MYKTYLTFSDEGLCNAALTHLFQIASVNNPKKAQARALSIDSCLCVSAQPGMEPAFNYASRTTQDFVAGDLSNMEALIDSGWRRMESKGEYPAKYVNAYLNLEQEIKKFLDDRRGMAAVNIDDLKLLLE